jgi:hypothetical protein
MQLYITVNDDTGHDFSETIAIVVVRSKLTAGK